MKRNKRRTVGACFLLLASLLLAGCSGGPAPAGFPVLRSGQEEPGVEAEELPTEPVTEEAQICVYVCGCVRSPGIFWLRDGARLIEAVDAAGGFTGEADTESRNLAQKLMDGEQIRIPSLTEKEAGAEAVGAQTAVNLNTADREELMTLPGIGEAKAEAILRSREEEGPFRKIEDIQRVSGIGPAAFQKLRDHIRV